MEAEKKIQSLLLFGSNFLVSFLQVDFLNSVIVDLQVKFAS